MSQLSTETVRGKCCRAYGCHDYSLAAGKTTESHSLTKYQCLLTIGAKLRWPGSALPKSLYESKNLSLTKLQFHFEMQNIEINDLHLSDGVMGRENVGENDRSGSGECKQEKESRKTDQ